MPDYKCECERFAAEGGVPLLHTPQCRFFDQAAVDYYAGFSIDRSICDHGSLRRKCEICERDNEIAELKKRIKTLEEEIELLQELQLLPGEYACKDKTCEWCNGTGKDSIDGQLPTTKVIGLRLP